MTQNQHNSQEQISQQEVNNLLYAAQQLEQQASRYKQQMDVLDNYKNDLQESEITLDELKKCKDGHSILIPIGGGNFVRGIVEKTDVVIGTIGARIHVEQPISNAIERIKSKKEEVEKQFNQIKASYNEVIERLKEIDRVVRSLS